MLFDGIGDGLDQRLKTPQEKEHSVYIRS